MSTCHTNVWLTKQTAPQPPITVLYVPPLTGNETIKRYIAHAFGTRYSFLSQQIASLMTAAARAPTAVTAKQPGRSKTHTPILSPWNPVECLGGLVIYPVCHWCKL